MPTGYTHAVQSGKITEFKDYALACARAFGACVTMREDNPEAKIPDEFAPDDYHEKELSKAKENLLAFDALDGGKLRNRYIDETVEITNRRKDAERQRQKKKGRYEAMLAKVREWIPPSDDHRELKAFMESQLTESIKFDCSGYELPPLPNFAVWKSSRRESLVRSVDYHAEELAKEIERTTNRNMWLRLLRESLREATTESGQ